MKLNESSFNDWFLALPKGRQVILRDDKWAMADAYGRSIHERMTDEIAELREVLGECRGALSACSIQESRNDGTENRMKIKALDKLVESVDLTLAKHK